MDNRFRIFISEALEENYPAILFRTYDTVETIETTANIDRQLIHNRALELQAKYNSQEYARLRKVEYDLLNQDELRYDDIINNTTTWIDAIQAIKNDFPKSEV